MNPPRGGRWGTPHPASCASHARPWYGGGHPDQAAHSPSVNPLDVVGVGGGHTASCASRVQPGDRGGHPGQVAGSPSVYPGYGGGWGSPTQQHAYPTRGHRIEGGTPTWRRAPPGCRQGTGDGGHPLSSNARSQNMDCRRGRGEYPPARKGKRGHPPSSNVCSLHPTCRRWRGWGAPDKEEEGGHPPSSNARYSRKASRRVGEVEPPIIIGPPLQDKAGDNREQRTADRTGNGIRRTFPIRGEGGARGISLSHSVEYS